MKLNLYNKNWIGLYRSQRIHIHVHAKNEHTLKRFAAGADADDDLCIQSRKICRANFNKNVDHN